jgi:hypothetical protein
MSRFLQPRYLFPAILAMGLFVLAARPVVDPDLWWHLKTGQLILQNRAVFHADPFSFTRAGAPWLNHEWLSDVLMFVLYRAAGWAGLIVTFAAIITATFLLAFYRCAGRRYLAGLLTLWAAIASIPLWDVRPQILSFFLASLLLVLHDRSIRRPNLLWWAVPLMLLWANLHAGFALGVVLLAIFLAGTSLDAIFGFESWPAAKSRLRISSLVLITCVAVVAINPAGSKLYWYPFATLRSASMQKYIAEWASPNFHQAQFVPLALLMLASLAALALSSKRLSPAKLLLLGATNFAALLSIRHIAIYALVVTPILSELLAGSVRPARTRVPGPRSLVMNGLLLAGFGVFAVVHVASVIAHQPATVAARFPERAVTFLSQQHIAGPVLNHYDWGGYMIWRLYPQYKVFIDGRADVYGDTLMHDFASTYSLTDDWRAPLDRWQIRSIILPPDAPLITALQHSASWKKVYSDSQATILTRAD